VEILEEPEKPDLQEIYDQFYIAPVDDTIDLENHCVIPGAWGYHFDMEKAQKQVNDAEFGETVYISMEFLEPEIYGDKVYFRDVLGYCETQHTDDANRNNNLRRACESMNGVVLQPGEVFSYNDTLGQRTKENGYLPAGAYSGWELVQSYGGGICQGSSTVYCAALYADMEIVHRRNHGYRVGYMQPGLDATVNWGGPDFQFRNSSHFPIKIAAEVSDGCVKVTILGTEDRDYYIEMETEVQWGSSGTYAKSYRCKYDKETGELISRELEARSNYAS
jgi:vancomycin resistance protein YoaR